MNALEKIVARKFIEVSERKNLTSGKDLEKRNMFLKQTYSLKHALLNSSKYGIIAEHKRKSPSKGIINDQLKVDEVTQGYVTAGASALSVLTDIDFFDGNDEQFVSARLVNEVPMLRKDFIIDEYQILESKSIGADVILLIAANLKPSQTKALASFAKSLNLEVLLEIHNKEELGSHLNEFIDVVGVNNRNLKTMKTDLNTSRELSEIIPEEFLKISESGINDPKILKDLKFNYGYNGFLIGEYFMQQSNPGLALDNFIREISLT